MDVLFLDDEASRLYAFESNTKIVPTWVWTFYMFKEALNHSKFDLIMLDHDLGKDQKNGTGSDAAKFLAENRLLVGDSQRVIIHSANPIGVANMLSHMKYADHLEVSVIHEAWNKCNFDKNGLFFRV